MSQRKLICYSLQPSLFKFQYKIALVLIYRFLKTINNANFLTLQILLKPTLLFK
jgi:hypothetical protein